MSLTEEQKAAIAHKGNLLLTACPGSGKTRTIVAKLLCEIEESREAPRKVACITYTNTAVGEIEQRLSAYLLDGDEHNYTVSTIHSFCFSNILKKFAWRVPGFNNSMHVLSPEMPEFEEIAKDSAADIGYTGFTFRDREAFGGLSIDIDGDPSGTALNNDIIMAAAPIFWKKCQARGYIDFSSIVYKSYCLVRDHKDIRDSLCARFHSFLIDEFQDTNEVQVEILRLLYQTRKSRFFLVGDPNQSIFAFAGAKPELIIPFASEINARTDLNLTGNFRSNPAIVNYAERVLPRLPPMRSLGPNATCTEAPSSYLIANSFNGITDHFLPKMTQLGIPFGRAAILAKSWLPLIGLSRELRNYGIPVVGPGARPYRGNRLFASLAEQLCACVISGKKEHPRPLQRALFYAVNDVSGVDRFDLFGFEGRVIIAKLMREAVRLANLYGGSDWLDHMSKYVGTVLVKSDFVSLQRQDAFFISVQEMKEDMRRQNIDIPNLSIEDLGLFAHPDKALRLTSIHGAKGQEYDAVAVINMIDGKLPDYRSYDPPAIDEERRLFYVAATRARRVLMFFTETNDSRNRISRFLRQ